MEKTWETFWASGKVTDYLTYRNGWSEQAQEDADQGQRKRENYGTVRDSGWHGPDGYANR